MSERGHKLIEAGYFPFPGSKISLQSEGKSTSLPKFIKNEIVKGKVLKALSSNSVLLLIKGRRIVARTHIPLREGVVISLKVEELSPFPILKLLGVKFTSSDAINIPNILSAMKENLWKTIVENIDYQTLPKEETFLFKELIDDLSQRLFLKAKPDLLRDFIDKSGFNWEAKLKKIFVQKVINEDNFNKLIAGDLKGLGSKFLGFKGEHEVLLNRFVSVIKNIQLLNCFGLEQEGKIFLPIPIRFPDGFFTVGQLLIQLHQKKKDEHYKKRIDKALFRVSFLLELSNLGPLRADLTISGKDIKGRFLLTNKEAKSLIEKKLPSLINSLKERGFSINHMGCHLRDSEVVKQTLIKEIVQEEGYTISLVA